MWKQKNKTFKQRDTEMEKGKKSLRVRELEEQEEMQQIREYKESRKACQADANK